MKIIQTVQPPNGAPGVQSRKSKIPIAHKQTQQQQRWFFSVIFILFFASLWMIDIDVSAVQKGIERIPGIAASMADISFENAFSLLDGMATSLVIAFLAVVLSIFLSLFLSLLMANNTTPHRYLGISLRYILMMIRSIPTPVWVLIAVASLGFGPMAGILGLLFPTCSFLIKAFAAQIEETGDEVIEAIRSTGGTWWHVVVKGLIPAMLTGLLATLAFRFELDVHESVILGMVGAGGIGYLLQNSIHYYDFSTLTLGIFIVFVTMFFIEMLTNRIRIKFDHRK